MADAAKIAQSRPAAATITDLYTVPASTLFAGKLTMVNDTATAIKIAVSIAAAGAADATSQYIIGGQNATNGYLLQGGGVPEEIKGITLGATDKVRVYSTTVGTVFTLNGIERT